MSDLTNALDSVLRRYELRVKLDDADRAALRDLPFRLQTMQPSRYLVREGSEATHSVLLITGIAFRHKLTPDGARQIVSIHIAGDFVDLECSLIGTADHNVQTLVRCEIAMVPIGAVIGMLDAHPRLARAMWIDTLIDGSIFREWVVNVGRRDARARLAHLLCEFARRLEVAGLAQPNGYEFPMTQEQLADATGLTAVHVNRTLKVLENEGLIKRDKRFVIIPDWERLRDAAGFNEMYLHLDLVSAAA